MSYNCPVCNSENTQRVSVLHASGTATTISRTIGTVNGLSYGNGGAGVIGGTTSGTTTVQKQTILAEQLAPPVKRDESYANRALVRGIILGGVAGAVMVPVTQVIYSFFPRSVFFGAIFMLMIPATFFAVVIKVFGSEKARAAENKKFNNSEYLEHMQQWNERFYCLKCGNIFIPT